MQCNQSHQSPCVHCSWSVNYDITNQTNHGSADSFYNETWKLWHHSHVFHNLRLTDLNRQGHCDTKTSIETMWEQSVIVTSQLLAVNSSLHFEIVSSSSGIKCGFTQVRRQKSHKWLAHWIPRPSIVRYVLCKERQASRFQRRWWILLQSLI